MKTFEEQNQDLVNFDKIFDSTNASHCVHRAVLLIRNKRAQMIESGYEFNINIDSCKWRIEQEILNRSSDKSMMQAAMEYVETVCFNGESFAGIQ